MIMFPVPAQLTSLLPIPPPCLLAAELAQRYKTDGMLAYVELIQRREKEIGCDVLTHQKWSGASYVDRILASECNRWCVSVVCCAQMLIPDLLLPEGVTAGSSATSAMGEGSTESSFV